MKQQVVKVFNKGTNDLPNYSTEFAAGFDIRADLSRVSQLSDLMGNDSLSLTIKEDGEKIITLFPKGGRVLIPTGLHVSIPDNYELQIRPRSGLALKNGITIMNSPGTIDCVPKGTKITTIDGDKLIEDLYNEEDKTIILSYNEELDLVEEDILSDMWIVEDLKLIKITTYDNEVIVPESKKIFTKRGWIMASQLNIDDEVLTF